MTESPARAAQHAMAAVKERANDHLASGAKARLLERNRRIAQQAQAPRYVPQPCFFTLFLRFSACFLFMAGAVGGPHFFPSVLARHHTYVCQDGALRPAKTANKHARAQAGGRCFDCFDCFDLCPVGVGAARRARTPHHAP